MSVMWGAKQKQINKQTKITNKNLKNTNTLRLMYTPLHGHEINEEIKENIYVCVCVCVFIYSYKQMT